MTFLTAHLPFPGQGDNIALPPVGSHLIISDTLPSPGHFAVYHLIAAAIQQKRQIVLVDFQQHGRASYEAVLRKMSVVLPASPGFTYISPISIPAVVKPSSDQPALFDEEDQPTLHETYASVIRQMSNGSLLILNGLSELVSIGFSIPIIHQFVRSAQAATRKTSGILVSTLHAQALGSSSPDQALLDQLLRTAHGWWRIDNLQSGRSSDVHGEISSFPLNCASPEWGCVPKSQPLQYRLEGAGVKVFPKGTGRGYL